MAFMTRFLMLGRDLVWLEPREPESWIVARLCSSRA